MKPFMHKTTKNNTAQFQFRQKQQAKTKGVINRAYCTAKLENISAIHHSVAKNRSKVDRQITRPPAITTLRITFPNRNLWFMVVGLLEAVSGWVDRSRDCMMSWSENWWCWMGTSHPTESFYKNGSLPKHGRIGCPRRSAGHGNRPC